MARAVWPGPTARIREVTDDEALARTFFDHRCPRASSSVPLTQHGGAQFGGRCVRCHKQSPT